LRRICQTEPWQIGFVYLPDREDPNVIVRKPSAASAISASVRFMRRPNTRATRIMRYRATAIGAQFSIAAAPGGGTLVVCALRKPPTMTERQVQTMTFGWRRGWTWQSSSPPQATTSGMPARV
jgi:hypothetical protein